MIRLISGLRIFVSSAWLSYVALFHWIEPIKYVASKVIYPLSQILFFTYLGMSATGRESADFYIVGNALQVAAVNGVYGVTMTIGFERNTGTLIYLVGSSANRPLVFLGRTFFNVIDGMFTVVLGFLWGVLVLNLDLSAANLPVLGLTILVTAASTCGLGVLMGCLSLMALNVMFVNNTVYFLLLIFSGANLPLAQLPSWMQAISQWLPLTRGIEAARLLVRGAALGDVGSLLAGELAIGLMYGLAGFFLFRWFEDHARRRGTLEAF